MNDIDLTEEVYLRIDGEHRWLKFHKREIYLRIEVIRKLRDALNEILEGEDVHRK